MIDDLTPPSDPSDLEVYRRDLARLVVECRARNIKVVLTCQTHVWDFYRLGRDISPSDMYQPDPRLATAGTTQSGAPALTTGDIGYVQAASSHSFALADFTPDELEEAISQRLPKVVAERAALLLRAPAFALLRRPYFLERYLEQYTGQLGRTDIEPVPVDIDALLDARLQALLVRVASISNADENAVQLAFDALLHLLWDSCPQGVSSAEAETCLEPHLRSGSRQALEALRQVGVLTARESVRFAETLLAERVFARMLRAQHDTGGDVLRELRPEKDGGVVSALLRSLAANDPITPAQALLERDRRWLEPIAQGLAQCS